MPVRWGFGKSPLPYFLVWRKRQWKCLFLYGHEFLLTSQRPHLLIPSYSLTWGLRFQHMTFEETWISSPLVHNSLGSTVNFNDFVFHHIFSFYSISYFPCLPKDRVASVSDKSTGPQPIWKSHIWTFYSLFTCISMLHREYLK